VNVPAGLDQHRLAIDLRALECLAADRPAGTGGDTDHNRIEVGQRLEGELSQVFPIGIAVKRSVQIGAGVGYHLDLADLKFDPGTVMRARGFPAQVVADDRAGKAGISGHPVLYGMTKIDESHRKSVNGKR
jgi:hypothetical protein